MFKLMSRPLYYHGNGTQFHKICAVSKKMVGTDGNAIVVIVDAAQHRLGFAVTGARRNAV